LAAAPLAHLEYMDDSGSARVETAYTMELFEVRLAGAAVESAVSAGTQNRWLTEKAIADGVAGDGGMVSRTMALLLSRAGLLKEPPEGEASRRDGQWEMQVRQRGGRGRRACTG
jgi:hypothetical protein